MMAMKAAKMSQTIKKIQKVRIGTLEWKDSNLKTDEVRTTKKLLKRENWVIWVKPLDSKS